MPREKVYAPKKSAKQIAKEEKAQLAAAAKKRNEDERAAMEKAKQQAIQDKMQKARANEVAKAHWSNERRVAWNIEINQIVAAVNAMRNQNPNRYGINAGANSGLTTTEGGTDNPLLLAWPSGAPSGLSKGDVMSTLGGFEGSDSGLVKIRRNDVFVHLR